MTDAPRIEAVPTAFDDETTVAARTRLVSWLAHQGIRDRRVLEAVAAVPRHEFVPAELRSAAYDDRALPITLDQTISQPYVVALMTELARVTPQSKVLEVGTGSGYQCAILSRLTRALYTIEVLESLALQAHRTLVRLGMAEQVRFRIGDGWEGWPQQAPFDAILVTAAPPQVPEALVDQLAPGGRLVIPVGTGRQQLELLEKTPSGLRRREMLPVRFVPMTHG
jgi:protein-L-isoaspartate(D-aspartate) O-methyltransferase